MSADQRGEFLNVPRYGRMEKLFMSGVVDGADTCALRGQSEITHEVIEQLLPQPNKARRAALPNRPIRNK